MPNEKEGSLLYWLFKKRFEYSAFTTMSFKGKYFKPKDKRRILDKS